MRKKLIFRTILMILLSINAMATTVPEAPVNAGAYKFTENTARLSFKDMSDNEDGFKIYHNGVLIGKVGAKDGNETYQYITLRNLEEATLYTVNIIAYNDAGESTPLIKSFRTIKATPSNVPAQPGAYIGVWNETKDSVRISFMDNSDNEDGFRVEDLDGNILMDNIPPKDSNGTYQYTTLNGLDEGKLYFIRVFAYNDNGDSTPSSNKAFRTKEDKIYVDENLISTYEIKNVDSIEDGIRKIITSVNEYGFNEYNEEVKNGIEQPYFWLLKPLNRSANNIIDMFAPSFTDSIKQGACFQKYFHDYMNRGFSIYESQKKAKNSVSNCMKENESPLEGKFASEVRQMVLCHPEHGQLLLDKEKILNFAAAMPCHISIYKKDDKVFVSWRNVYKMAKNANLPEDENKIAEEIQKSMQKMLSYLE